MELFPLHRCDESVVKQTARLLNSEWQRSETARIHSLSSDCSHDLPCSLVLLEKVTGHADKRVIGHGRLSQVLGKPTAVIIESDQVILHKFAPRSACRAKVSLIVVKDKRGCGLGRKIMDLCETYALQLGYTTSHLSTHDKCTFYEHLGYVYSSPVSPARASARLLKHNQISALQTHFGENVMIQQPATKHLNTGGPENMLQQQSMDHTNSHIDGKGENGKESLEKIMPAKHNDGTPLGCVPEYSCKKHCEPHLTTASGCTGVLSCQSESNAPPCPPPPPPPQMNHTAQEISKGAIFWMTKELNKA